MKKLSAILMIIGTLFFFQNCGSDIKFDSIGDGDLVTKKEAPQEAQPEDLDIVVEPAIPKIPIEDGQITYVQPPKKEYDDDDKDKEYDDHGEHEEHRGCVERRRKKEVSKREYICILDGHGKSQHLAFNAVSVYSDNSTPHSLCMSMEACLDIASKKYNVKAVGRRGYCKNGKAGTRSVSEEELVALISEDDE